MRFTAFLRQPRAQHFGLCAAVVIALLGHVHFATLTFDDAFISFRYAENLANGNGLVFNLGERVEGYSNLLWTLLLALPIELGVDHFELGLLVAAKLLGSAFNVATLVVVTRAAALGRRPDQLASTPIAALYLATLAPFLVWGVGALETPLVTLLITVSVYLHLREDSALSAGVPGVPWSYLALLLSALTRPEPVVLFLPLAGLRLWRSMRAARNGGWQARELSFLALFIVPYALFILARFRYYGQLLPNTYFAKMYGDPRTERRGFLYLDGAFELLNWTGLGLFAAMLLLVIRRISYRNVAVLLVCVVHLVAVYYEGGDWMSGYRLIVPILPLVGLLVCDLWLATGTLSLSRLMPEGPVPAWLIRPDWLSRIRGALQALQDWTQRFRNAPRLGRVLQGILALILLSGSVTSFDSARVRTFVSGFHGFRLDGLSHFRVARWMVREIREPGLLAIGEAGIIPYYTKLPVLDLHGLVDPHISRLPGGMHRKFDGDYVFARRPKYVFLPVFRGEDGKLGSLHSYAVRLLSDPRFAKEYQPLHDFGEGILYVREGD